MKDNEKFYVVAGAVLFVVIILLTILLLPKKDVYSVTFKTDDAVYLTSDITQDKTVTKPNDPVKEGYSFLGWYYNDTLYDFTTPITENIVLEARWEEVIINTYTITFDTDGGDTIESIIVNEGSTITEIIPTKDGYNFLGWYYNDTLFDFTTKIESDITLKASWEKIEQSVEEPDEPINTVTKYTVKFDSNGGSSVSSQSVVDSKTATKPKNPTRSGYTFKGWTLNNQAYDFSKPVTKDITLKASWEKTEQSTDKPVNTVTKYTVKFDSNGGSSVSSQSVVDNKTATKPKDPTRSGYTFKGWTLNNQSYNFNTPVTKDITLKASWEKIETKYTVKFDSNGGSSVSSQSIVSNKTATKPKDPTRSGYTFKGWTLNNQAYDFNTPVTKDITLKASWEEIITYDIEWVKVESSSIGQYYLYIKNSKGRYVSGKVEITTIDDKTDTKTVPSTGLMLIKSVVKSASVKSVD